MAAQDLSILFLDDEDAQYNQVDAVLKSFFAHKFGSGTVVTHSETTVTVEIEIPMDLPAGVYFRLMHYGEYSMSSKVLTPIENCGSSPTISLSEQYYTIQVDDLVDDDIVADTIIKFSIDDISLPVSEDRAIYYYQIGYNGDAILEGGGSIGNQTDMIKTEEL
mmetsp:Transcript_12653/g.12478  ORF Transcript_12653/g.12478 Transcript_12653/m.12478 type:complete len:163 (-) Transcript_12653:572-1060(-)